jgi:hypothetical protein
MLAMLSMICFHLFRPPTLSVSPLLFLLPTLSISPLLFLPHTLSVSPPSFLLLVSMSKKRSQWVERLANHINARKQPNKPIPPKQNHRQILATMPLCWKVAVILVSCPPLFHHQGCTISPHYLIPFVPPKNHLMTFKSPCWCFWKILVPCSKVFDLTSRSGLKQMMSFLILWVYYYWWNSWL